MEFKKDVLVYISGPITAQTGYPIEANVAQAIPIYHALLNRGIAAFLPHLNVFVPSAWSEVNYKTWLQYDLRIIDFCTHVILLNRWEESKGCNVEIEYARQLNKPIYENLQQLLRDLGVA